MSLFFLRLKLCSVLSIILLASVSIGATSRKSYDNAVTQELQRLQNADPAIELQKNWEKKDFRFYGLLSFTVEIPGVVGQQFNSYVKSHGIRLIKGTGDVVDSQERLKLQDSAYDYAERYNKLLLKRLVDKEGSLPSSTPPDLQELHRLESADIKLDLERALEKGDSKFISVLGVAAKAPGVSSENYPYVRKQGVKMIGISKGSNGNQQAQLRLIARMYASEYNYLLIRHLKSKSSKGKKSTRARDSKRID